MNQEDNLKLSCNTAEPEGHSQSASISMPMDFPSPPLFGIPSQSI